MLVPLGLLPAVTYVLVAYWLRPVGPVVGPVRLALVRAAVLVGACAAVAVEGLSLVQGLTRPALVALWSVGLLAALVPAIRRYRRERRLPGLPGLVRRAWTGAGRGERIMAVTLAALLLAELLIAVVSPPNNYDSQTYHLPKIEHWVVQRDVDFYATRIHRQLSIAPGAEYLLLHLRLLTGGDALYNLLQYAAGIGCALLASRIAGQLGGSRRAQLITAFVVGTTPIVGLESTSTQTDLVVAAWVGCVATLALDRLTAPTPLAEAALLGGATGLTVLTKATGMLAAGPLLAIWFGYQLRRGVLRALAGALLVAALATLIAGPYLHRLDAEYDNPLGPSYLRDSISMQRHDPASILVNALRIGQTALQIPLPPVNTAAAHGVERLSRAMGIDPSDQKITFWGSTFPSEAWVPDEDRASFPVTGILVLLGAGFLLFRRGTRRYSGVFWLALLIYLATVKWQPWGNRLILFLLVLGAPLAGLWLDGVLSRPGRRFPAWLATLALLAGGVGGCLAVGYGWPRRLVGTGSVFTESRMEARFQRRPSWRADYEWAAGAVRAAGAHRIGLVQGEDTWEYPWWVLLRGDDIVSLQSLQADLPAAKPDSVDAIVCVAPVGVCQYYLPKGWQLHMHGDIGYAVR